MIWMIQKSSSVWDITKICFCLLLKAHKNHKNKRSKKYSCRKNWRPITWWVILTHFCNIDSRVSRLLVHRDEKRSWKQRLMSLLKDTTYLFKILLPLLPSSFQQLNTSCLSIQGKRKGDRNKTKDTSQKKPLSQTSRKICAQGNSKWRILSCSPCDLA
jgi:hypothetical protein